MSETIVMLLLFGIILMGFELSRHMERNKWQEERKDLYDRLMSKSLPEYKEQTSAPQTFEPIVQSEQTEYWQEIEENKR